MSYAGKRRLAIRAGAVLVVLGFSMAIGGVAHAWPNKDVTVETDCAGATLTGHGFKHGDQMAESIDWEINTAPVTAGSLTPEAPTVTVELPPGHYTVTWKLVIKAGETENGPSKDFDVPACPAPDAALDCVDEILVLTLSNAPEANADAALNVEVNGEGSEVTVSPGEQTSMPVGVDEGEEFTIKVTSADDDVVFEESGVVECMNDQAPPTTQNPTPTGPAKGSTLPHTGAGFPTGIAAALAVLLVAVGGFMLTYRRETLATLLRR